MSIRLKRVYEEPEASDGYRVLVDRLWPRGLSKESAALDLWAKEVAPSNELRRWFGHEEERWEEFKKRYRAELEQAGEQVQNRLEELAGRGRNGTLTLLYAARESRHNNAELLKSYLEEKWPS